MMQTEIHPQRTARLFLLAVSLYFLAQFALRLAIGGALETDEAEMVLLVGDWRWGYGPQLPLYNWMQTGAFAIFGKGVLALALVKNLSLWASYLLVFSALRRGAPVGLAVAGALSLALLPDVFWEGQRATTHSVALILTIAMTFAALAAVLERGRPRDYLWLGVALGLGGLSKFNYWLVPVALAVALVWAPQVRARLAGRGLALSLAVAVAILALPYAWIARHPAQAFASNYKLSGGEAFVQAVPGLNGLLEATGGLFAGLGLVALVAGGLWLGFRRGGGEERREEPLLIGWLGRGVLLAVLAFGAFVLISGATHVTSRWLMPVFLMGAPVLIYRAVAAVQPMAGRVLIGLVLGLAGLTLVGMAGARLYGPARGAVDFAPLEAALAPMQPEGTTILADFYIGGNLAWRHPEWQIFPPQPTHPLPVSDEVIVLLREEAGLAYALERSGLAAGVPVAVVSEQAVALPYRFDDTERLRVQALRVKFGG